MLQIVKCFCVAVRLQDLHCNYPSPSRCPRPASDAGASLSSKRLTPRKHIFNINTGPLRSGIIVQKSCGSCLYRSQISFMSCLNWQARLSFYVKLFQAFKRCINQCNTFLEWWLILKFNSSENLPWIDDGKEVIQSTCHISSQSTTTYFEPPKKMSNTGHLSH